MLDAEGQFSGEALSLGDIGLGSAIMELPLVDIGKAMAALKKSRQRIRPGSFQITASNEDTARQLPKRITFPYSRHSSLEELRDLVRIFKPRAVYPCTVDEHRWNEGQFNSNLYSVVC